MKELGSPQRIAAIIKADLNNNTSDPDSRGYFTEKGYQDTVYVDEKYEIVDVVEQPNQKNTKDNTNQKQSHEKEYSSETKTYTAADNTQNKSSKTNLPLIILIALFTSPIWIPLFLSLFGVGIGVTIAVVATIFSLFFGFGLAGLCMMGAGIALFIVGIIKLGVPLIGLLLCGAGLLVFGLGMLFVLLSAVIFKALPAIFRGFINLCRLPFKNRSVMA
ncbi:hypothetical protein I5677_04500 [Mobilitalea sibirica]|uniref:DUF1700 domain-containing protein n=1 Tax=Mobilitalea sibirica TaxID=1462919 RepID=A0A8J7H1A8_9FIRM|nr:hypothetical protein [Mobilitalea sibirica]MBH1940154.1 hypothetical protein [Mobilitalea sibirica]